MTEVSYPKRNGGWLVRWEASEQELESLRKSRLVTLLEGRFSVQKVQDYLRILYSSHYYSSVAQRLIESEFRSARRYQPKNWRNASVDRHQVIYGEYTPLLIARRAFDLRVEKLKNGLFRTYWSEGNGTKDDVRFCLETKTLKSRVEETWINVCS